MSIPKHDLENGSSKIDSEEIQVRILPKVIAAGKTDNRRLKVMLQLQPYPVKKGVAGAFALQDWPEHARKAVADLLATDKAFVLKRSGSLVPLHLSDGGQRLDVAFPKAESGENSSNMEFVTKCWQAAIAGFDRQIAKGKVKAGSGKPKTMLFPDAWPVLYQALCASRAGGGLSNSSNKSIGVFANRQKELACGLELLRAKELLGCLSGEYTPKLEGEITHALYEQFFPKLKKDIESSFGQLPVQESIPKDVIDNQTNTEQAKVRQALLDEAKQFELEILKNACVKNPENKAKLAEAAKEKLSEFNKALFAYIGSHAYAQWPHDPSDNEKIAEQARKSGQAAINDVCAIDLSKVELIEELRPLVAQRFFNLQANPVLARMFLFNVDLELDAVSENGEFLLQVETPGIEAFVEKPAIATKCALDDEQFWPSKGDGKAAKGDGKATIKFGVFDLSAKSKDGCRFDVSSLDVRSAAEHANERNRRRLGAFRLTGFDAENKPIWERDTAVEELTHRRETLMSSGLCLLDGERGDAVSNRLAARQKQNKSAGNSNRIEIDADDLLQGIRIDAAVALSKGEANWHSLMNRDIIYGGSPTSDVEQLLELLGIGMDTPARRLLDAATVAPGLRLSKSLFEPKPNCIEEAGSPNSTGEREGIVEELLTVWDGTPMGVDCSGPRQAKKDFEDLPFDRTLKLPTRKNSSTANADLPPDLRFGRAYKIGARAVFQGGISQRLEQAKKLYDDEGHAFPPKNGSHAYRRFLRHERLSPPVLLLPASEALKPNGQMGFQQSGHAVIRSYFDGDRTEKKKRATPDKTVRYFLPPPVDQHFAALHGTFDSENGVSLDNGIKAILTDKVRGGFPAAQAVTKTMLNGESVLVSRKAVFGPTEAAETILTTQNSLPNYANKGDCKYFADPAADHYVLKLRYAGTDQYLEGVREIEVRAEKGSYRDIRPLRIVVMKGKPRISADERQDQLFDSVVSKEKLVRITEPLPGKNAQMIQTQEVKLRLAPGDDFELVVFCVPKEEKLVRLFAVVESIGTLAHLYGNAAEYLKSSFGVDSIAEQRKSNNIVGCGCLETADNNGKTEIAKQVLKAMYKRPAAELASLRVVQVTHAVNMPRLVPQLRRPGDELSEQDNALALCRLSRSHMNEFSQSAVTNVALGKGGRYDTYFDRRLTVDDNIKNKPGPQLDPGAHDYALGGTLYIDLDTSDSFEIIASTTSARSTLFDDPNRRRSAIDRRRGQWPTYSTSQPGQKETDTRLIPTASLYGFHVFEDGRVILPQTNIKLFKVDNLKSRAQGGAPTRVGGLEYISIENFYGIKPEHNNYQPVFENQNGNDAQANDSGKEVPQHLQRCEVNLEHAFPDGKARKLRIWVESVTRFAELMATAPGIDSEGFFHAKELLKDSDDSVRSDRDRDVTVWLPATVRPAKPETRSPIPVFKWNPESPNLDLRQNKSDCIVERASAVRVPLRRGWFSSGEGERLGVVLWPPTLFSDKNDISTNTIELPTLGDDNNIELREVSVDDFTDEDLGPGGSFITRWGGDPIVKSSGGQTGFFLPASQFDLDEKIQKVTNVQMPIRISVERQPEEKDIKTDEGIAEYLTVSLLTFEPRFDVDREEWYVDIPIRSGPASYPFVRFGLVRYQEHASPDIKVSEPVVEWSQLLPKRRVTVTNLDDDIVVKVVGDAPLGQRLGKHIVTEQDKKFQQPVVRMSVFKESLVGGVQNRQLLIAEEINNLDILENGTEGSLEVWQHRFTGLRKRLLKMQTGSMGDKSPSGNRYFMHVEEVEMRQKATYEEEPIAVPANADFTQDYYIESGPRFMVTVLLKL